MCGRREISERHGEAGMLLMELAVSLPVSVCVCVCVCVCV